MILDDRSDIEPNKDHWVQTTMENGLGPAERDKAIQMLNKTVEKEKTEDEIN